MSEQPPKDSEKSDQAAAEGSEVSTENGRPDRAPGSFPLGRTIVGLLLVLLGTSILIDRLTGIRFEIFVAAVGVAFLLAWQRERKYGFLIPGAIVTGVGVGSILESFVAGSTGNALFLVSLAAGFASIWVLDRQRRRSVWGLIVSGALLLSAFGTFGFPFLSLLPAGFGEVLLPVVLMGLGALLIFRRSIPNSVARSLTITMVVLLALAVMADTDPLSFVTGFKTARSTETVSLPDLQGNMVVLEAGSGDIKMSEGDARLEVTYTVRANSRDQARDRLRGLSTRARTRAGDHEVVVETFDGSLNRYLHQGGLGSGVKLDYAVFLPEGSSVRAETGSGDLQIELDGTEVTANTGSGDLEVSGRFESLQVRTGSGDVVLRIETSGPATDVSVQTGSGDVDLEISGDPEIEVDTGSGDIDVSGFEASSFGSRSLMIEGTDGSVRVRTGSGDIELSRP